jgi:hypothetical protein
VKRSKKTLFRFASKRNKAKNVYVVLLRSEIKWKNVYFVAFWSKTKKSKVKRKIFGSKTKQKYGLLISLWSKAKRSEKRNSARACKTHAKQVSFCFVSLWNKKFCLAKLAHPIPAHESKKKIFASIFFKIFSSICSVHVLFLVSVCARVCVLVLVCEDVRSTLHEN